MASTQPFRDLAGEGVLGRRREMVPYLRHQIAEIDEGREIAAIAQETETVEVEKDVGVPLDQNAEENEGDEPSLDLGIERALHHLLGGEDVVDDPFGVAEPVGVGAEGNGAEAAFRVAPPRRLQGDQELREQVVGKSRSEKSGGGTSWWEG